MYPNNHKVVITSKEGYLKVKFATPPTGKGTYDYAEMIAVAAINEALEGRTMWQFIDFGGDQWSVETAESIINYVGVIDFALSSRSSTGSYRTRHKDLLEVYLQYLQKGVGHIFWKDSAQEIVSLAREWGMSFQFVESIYEDDELIETVVYTENSEVRYNA